MDFLSAQFFSALAAIIVIDLVLAGDNAIVIALAARNVPKHLQKRAIVWGAACAIIVRTLLTIAAVSLLRVPGLLFAGGALLIWIAFRLLVSEAGGNGLATLKPEYSFWGALRTIVIADMVMGLDNVLAVAGAAHGSYTLVVLGLLISVPIVGWGSSLLLRCVEHYPVIVDVGAGVLAWTAAKMITAEPFVVAALGAYRFTVPLTTAVIVFGVLWAGFTRNHRKLLSNISTRLELCARLLVSPHGNPKLREGETVMTSVLVPVDSSRNSQYAVRYVVNEYMNNPAMQIHLLNVQSPFSRYTSRFIGKKGRDTFHREEAEKVLMPIRQLLKSRNVPYEMHAEVGGKAQVITNMARRLRCTQIVMSTARKNSLTRMIEDSVTTKVLELTTVPVQIIPGDAVSRWERYGIPAAVGSAIALLILATS